MHPMGLSCAEMETLYPQRTDIPEFAPDDIDAWYGVYDKLVSVSISKIVSW